MIRRDGIVGGQIALIVAAGLAGNIVTANAAPSSYWPGTGFSYDSANYDIEPVRPAPRRIVRRPRAPKGDAIKAEKLAQSQPKPTGALVIAVSIEHQTVKVYDANGLFAESPISSGMKGHSTPMGVFSVIQKNKYHRSNIYSGAPMPYMQRITWSGVAMHAGVIPGYPASHGCIRMPMAFAVKLWGWTRMGARVVVTPGDISPANVSHPLLASLTSAPAAAVAAAPGGPSVKVADAFPVTNTQTTDASNSVVATMIDLPPASAAVTKDAVSPGAAPASVIETPVAAEPNVPFETPAAVEKPADKPEPTEAAPAPAVRSGAGPVAIFISRKDAKLYVRQNFTPLFDVPITISGDQPLGTHVFTAFADKDASKPVQWTALTLPASARSDEPLPSHRRQAAGAVAITSPVIEASAADALGRVKLPENLAARLGNHLSNGSSLVISDQGIAASGETGKGTDFIVRLR